MKYFMVNGNGKIDMQFCVPKHNFDMQKLTFQMFMLRST